MFIIKLIHFLAYPFNLKKITYCKLILIFDLIFAAFYVYWPENLTRPYICYAAKNFYQNDELFNHLETEFKNKNIHLIKSIYCPASSKYVITNISDKRFLLFNPNTPVFLLHKSSRFKITSDDPYVFAFTQKNETLPIDSLQISFDDPENAAKQIAETITTLPFVYNYFFKYPMNSHGLGNQLFDVFSTLSYAHRFHKKLFFLKNNAEFYHAFTTKGLDKNNLPKHLKLILELQKTRNIETSSSLKDTALFNSNKYSSISGYLQSFYNFHDSFNYIKSMLRFKPITDEKNKKLASLLKQENSVCMHVRLGDYVYFKYPILLDSQYFENAISYIQKRVDNPVFYVFTNGANVVQKHNFGVPVQIINHNQGKNSFRDIQLMSMCKHNIISNSTFSWMAAFFNNNPNKIVIYPDIWLSWDKNWIEGLRFPGWVEIKSGITYGLKNIIYPEKSDYPPLEKPNPIFGE